METLIKNKYQVSGMTCEACEYKVKTVLAGIEGVQNVDIDLKTGETTIESERKIPITELKTALKPHSKYQIERSFPLTQAPNAPTPVVQTPVVEEAAPSIWSTYYPLFLIASFITLVAFLTAFDNHTFTLDSFRLNAFLHNFMTGFFLVFSFFKLLNLKDFADSFAMYDLLAARSRFYALAYPFIELGLGIACLVHFQPQLTYIADIAIMGFGALGVVKSVLDKRKIRCACLGAVFNLPMSTVTIIENSIMVAIGAILLILN
ncbi:cation transporter [Runella sp. MFBS21]|uniref:heavy-metal-associated domain-containing protein n=1 Tax=Runella sp. MFBS21 TaxID=3034018 RepID=UPI0023F6C444|nr:MauE/DoxX family redox-associated membrane protein [Runella sp. MFBS21]MDF7818487.1 cation transporter [Runella sp. MFBS21]